MLDLEISLGRSALRAAADGLALDFVSGRTASGRRAYERMTAVPGAVATRAGMGWAARADGSWIGFAADTPRITDRGLWIEEARTNLFLNSAAPASQSLSLATGTYVLSAWGAAGSVSAAAGTAMGSGFGAVTATPGGAARTLTLTTAGTVVFTVTGAPSKVQVEAGSFATSPIETTGAAGTRGADAVSVPATVASDQDFAVVYEVELTRDTGAGRVLFDLSNGTSANKVRAVVQSSLALQHVVSVGGVNTTLSAATRSGARRVRGAVARTGSSWRSVLDGEELAVATVAGMTALTTLTLGGSVAGGAMLNDIVRSLTVIPGAVDTARLIEMTR